MQLTALLVSADFSAWFTARGERNDYGVPGSPTWWEPQDIELAAFEFLGRDVPLNQLPDAIEAALLEQADGLEWERDE